MENIETTKTFDVLAKEKKELHVVMYCLAVICVCCLAIVVIRNLSFAYRMGVDDANELSPFLNVLPDFVTLGIMAGCCMITFLMLFNVRRGDVFTRQNANLVIVIGTLIEFNGLFQQVYSWSFPVAGADNSVYMIYILLGVFFLFIGCLFKLGVHMKEEQDLTV